VPGPRTISHLSIPSSTKSPATERLERADQSLSVEVDFDTSQSNPHTQRSDDEWSADEGPSADDSSLAGSVVFDPDVLARETRNTNPPAAGPEAVNVVFDDLSLTPTAPIDIPRRSPVSGGRPSSRRDPNTPINEESETLPQSGSRSDSEAPVTRTAVSSGRGPRTIRRTGPLDVVVPGRVIANRYRIESLVGSGAVGAVYRATHVDLPRTFAIKVLHPHFRADQQLIASFRTEARAASLLDHPNVTVVHDFGEEPDGLVYIVMEYLQGTNLQAILDEQQRLPPRRAIEIMLQVCGALSAAHERGIVHRDVKPDNIMLVPSRDDEGRTYDLVKVCDFGIAALETAPDAKSGEWTAGTPEYMAPEQANGRADARTDVYACGIVLYEMLTGRPPFAGETPSATLAKHIDEVARPPSAVVPGFPPALEAVIMCAIEKAPDRRFRTIRDLRVELKRLL
jgi:tRNA A-37 threonylcarbamoyl transferase component Bud32